jgi:hypothetical protein
MCESALLMFDLALVGNKNNSYFWRLNKVWKTKEKY